MSALFHKCRSRPYVAIPIESGLREAFDTDRRRSTLRQTIGVLRKVRGRFPTREMVRHYVYHRNISGEERIYL